MTNSLLIILIIVVLSLSLAINWTRTLKDDERAVIFRWKGFHSVRGPGIIIVFSPIEKMIKISLQIDNIEIPPINITSVEEIKFKAKNTIHYQIINPALIAQQCDTIPSTMKELSIASIRDVLPAQRIYDLLYHRDEILKEVKENLSQRAKMLGIDIIEISDYAIEIPPEMNSAVARLVEDEEIRLKQLKMKR